MSRAADLWTRVPVLVRAAVIAFLILTIGQLPPGLFLAAGLRFTPRVPWWLPATAVWLWLFFLYLNGRWWPAGAADTRRGLLRAIAPPPRVWAWSLAAGGLGMVSVLTIALLTGLVATLPAEAYVAPFDLSRFPPWTVATFFLTVALMAGVVEEAAFRGYMLSMLERRYGWPAAIITVALFFYAVHLGHAYATIAFIPFFLAYSILHGTLVFLTRSILPNIVLHIFGDLTILPIQYGVVRNPLGSSVTAHGIVIVGFGMAGAVGLWGLRRIVRKVNLSPPAAYHTA